MLTFYWDTLYMYLNNLKCHLFLDLCDLSVWLISCNVHYITGFLPVMENLESHGISIFHFPGLESRGKWSNHKIWSWKVMEFQFLIKIVAMCTIQCFVSISVTNRNIVCFRFLPVFTFFVSWKVMALRLKRLWKVMEFSMSESVRTLFSH